MPTDPRWFEEDVYLNNKVIETNAVKQDGRTDWTYDEVKALIEENGMTPYEHFVRYGNAENVSPNHFFNVDEYFVAKTNQMNSINFEGRNNWTPAETVEFFHNVGMSAWDHYTQYGAAEGINPSNEFDTQAYLVAKAAQLNRIEQDGKTDWTPAETEAAIRAAGLNPIEHYFLYGEAEGIRPSEVPAGNRVTVPSGFNPWNPDVVPPTPGGDIDWDSANHIYLDDTMQVSRGEDGVHNLFIAPEFDGANTLQTGDRVIGGNETDMLLADVTAGNTFGQMLNSVRPTIQNVEILKFSSQQSTNYVDNPIQGNAGIRADRVQGAQEIWSSDSRANLHVEDVRIDSNKMLVGFQNADASHGNGPDYELHFNNQNLKADDQNSSGELVLKIIDLFGAVNGQPLLDNPYNGVRFYYKGELISLDFGRVYGPDATYEDLLHNINEALAANPQCAGLTARIGGTFTESNADHVDVVGEQIIISSSDGDVEVPTLDTFIADAGLPNPNNVFSEITPENDTDCPLIKTDIALDNVGMVEWNDPNICLPNNQQFGDHAGDMVVGGMGNGNWVGVQRFDVHVDRGSWLSSLASTNYALRMITVDNRDMDDADDKVGTSDSDMGNLYIGDGQRLVDNAIGAGSLMFEGRDGLLADAHYGDETASTRLGRTDSGILDVKVFDASGMSGKANISAAITDLSSKKYLGDSDQVDGVGEKFAPDGDFRYNFGSNDDTLNMSINGNVAADNDFTMNIDMGDGNNTVHTEFVTPEGSTNNWAYNQWILDNVNITTGAGDDIVNPWGSGRVKVFTGAGSDIVYSDNSGIMSDLAATTTRAATTPTPSLIEGVGSIWVKNAKTGATDSELAVMVNGLGEIVPYQNDIATGNNNEFTISNLNANYGSVQLRVTVTYKGITSVITPQTLLTLEGVNGGTGSVSIDTHVANQYIIDAVNNPSSWVHALLSAQEGAGHSLLLISKVDGDNDIPQIAFQYKQVNAPQNTAWANIDALNTQYANDDYATIDNGSGTFVKVQGLNSAAEADNRIDLGVDHDADLAVLSTGANSNETVVLTLGHFNDTIVNFSLDGDGKDFLDVTGILNGSPSADPIVGNTTASVDANISGARSIVFVTNSKDANGVDVIRDDATMLAAINAASSAANPTNNTTLFMVHNSTGVAEFDLYRAQFDANGNAQVTSAGSITFADFIVGGTVMNGVTNFVNNVAVNQVGLAGIQATDNDFLPDPVTDAE